MKQGMQKWFGKLLQPTQLRIGSQKTRRHRRVPISRAATGDDGRSSLHLRFPLSSLHDKYLTSNSNGERSQGFSHL